MATETFIIDVRTRGTKRSARDVKRIGTEASQVRKTLAFLRAALVAVAAVRVFANIVVSLIEFSDQMLVVKAVTSATTVEFARMREVAKGLGATTRFTAAEAADGMAFLARAGFDVNEVISAIPATLNLAAAAQLELGNAADIASNLMTSFGRTTAELPDIIDTLVFTANNANTTVQQLADGLKLFAPIASQLGISLKDASAAMAVLGDAGIQASLAGTGVRRVLTDLEAPTGMLAKALKALGIGFEEVRPSAVGLQGALLRLKEANVGASVSSLLFGKRGGFVAAQLLRALGPMGDFREELERIEGTATRVAEEMESGIGGALRLVRSAAQNLLIAFGDLGGEEFLNQFFRDLAEGLRFVARNADQVVKAMKFLLAAFLVKPLLLFGAALFKVTGAGALWAIATTNITRANLKAAFSFATLSKAIRAIPFVAVLSSLVILGAGLVTFANQIKVAGAEQQLLSDVFDELVFQLKGAVTDTINALGADFGDFSDIVKSVSGRVAAAIKGLVAVFAGLRAAVGFIFDNIRLEFLKFLRRAQATSLLFKQVVNSISRALGREDLFDTSGIEKSLTTMDAKIADINKGLEEGGTLFERFVGAGQEALRSINERALDRIAADRDAAILATEEANRRAAKARIAVPKEAIDAGITAEELFGDTDADKTAKEVESLTKALQGLEAAHFPLLAVMDDEAEVQKIINDARAKGIMLRVNEAELLKRVARARIGANMTLEQAQEEQQALRNELDKTNISLEEFEFLSRKAGIAFLDSQRDAASGAERAFLKLQQDATDAAAFTEMVMTDAFKAIEDAVVSFATTGTFSINAFFRNFAEQLIRLGTQQAIAGIGSAFPGFGAATGASGGQAGIGGLVASGLGSLFGFNDGGAFKVGASSAAASLPGIDNRLVAFRAQDGETVSITPKNQIAAGGAEGGALNIVFNVETRDADSFNRSQSQLQNRLLAGIGQARRRR